MNKKQFGAVLVAVCTIAGTAVAIAAWLWPDPIHKDKEPPVRRAILVPVKPPELPNNPLHETGGVVTQVAYFGDESVYVPFGNNVATIVELENKGDSAGIIQKVEYTIKARKKTPRRATQYAEAVTVPVNFTGTHYRGSGRFVLAFQNPQSARPQDFAVLKVAIIEPSWVNNTYVGTLTVFYDGGQRVDVDGVELDVLRRKPKD